MNAPEMARVYGYIRASTDKQIASPETQQADHRGVRQAARPHRRSLLHRPGDLGQEVDCSTATAGKELLARSCDQGDEVIVARLDRLSRSLHRLRPASWSSGRSSKITMHLCDMPGGVFDPDNPMSEMLIGILIVFANYERTADQRPHPGRAPGPQAARREVLPLGRSTAGAGRSATTRRRASTSTSRSPMTGERAIMAKCVELRAAG